MNSLIILLRPVIAIASGAAIGLAFGAVQAAALRRYQKKQTSGDFNSGWTVIPGSMSRVAGLLIVLALIQFVCPILFKDGIQWMVSTGLVLGYGWCLLRAFQQRRAPSV